MNTFGSTGGDANDLIDSAAGSAAAAGGRTSLPLVIDCDDCEVRGVGCDDCVVTAILRAAPPSRRPVRTALDSEQLEALDMLADAGLVAPLRLVSRHRAAG